MTIGEKIKGQIFDSEFVFQTSRSSGPGGQNVNKVNSKVTLRFDVANSEILSGEEKLTILTKLTSKLTVENELLIHSQDGRSQFKNKEDVIRKFYDLLKTAFRRKKIRKATKPTKSSVKKRLKSKKIKAEIKKNRQGRWD